MKEAILAFYERDFIKNSLKLISGTTLAQALMILISPLLSRIYSPENFGDLALFNSILGIGVVISTGRFEMAIIVADSEDDAKGLFQGIFFISIILNALATLIIGFNFFLVEMFIPQVWHFFIPIGLFFNAIFLSGSFYKNRQREFSTLARGKLGQTLANSMMAITGGLAGLESIGLVLGSVFGFFIGAVWYYPNKIFKKRVSLGPIFERYSEFPKYSLPSGLLDTFSQHVPVLLFTYFFTLELTGHYSMAMKVLLLPLSMIGNAVGHVFYQKFNLLVRENRTAARMALLKMWLTLFLIGILPLTGVFFWGTDIVMFIFGRQWETTGRIAQVLSPALLAMFISSPTSSGFIVLGIQKYHFLFNIFVLFYRVTALLVGVWQRDFILGLQIWVVLELIQIFLYNLFMWRKV